MEAVRAWMRDPHALDLTALHVALSECPSEAAAHDILSALAYRQGRRTLN